MLNFFGNKGEEVGDEERLDKMQEGERHEFLTGWKTLVDFSFHILILFASLLLFIRFIIDSIIFFLYSNFLCLKVDFASQAHLDGCKHIDNSVSVDLCEYLGKKYLLESQPSSLFLLGSQTLFGCVLTSLLQLEEILDYTC